MQERARVILYSKPGCHLCEEMKIEMARADCAHLYEMEEINIEEDEKLLSQHRYNIPVLTVDGIEAFKHRLKADEFRDYLSQHRS